MTDHPYTKADATVLRSILAEAEEVVNGPRAIHYGPPTVNFQRIADLWTTWLHGRPEFAAPLTPYDVAYLMILMKLARLQHQPYHRDIDDLEAALREARAAAAKAENQVRHWKEQEAKQRRLHHEQGDWKHRALESERRMIEAKAAPSPAGSRPELWLCHPHSPTERCPSTRT